MTHVICVDMTDFTTRFRNEKEIVKIMQQEIIDDVLKVFPDIEVKERDDLIVFSTASVREQTSVS